MKSKTPNADAKHFAGFQPGDLFEIRGRIYWYWPKGGFDDADSQVVVWLGKDGPPLQEHPPLVTRSSGETWTSASATWHSPHPRLGTPRTGGTHAWILIGGAPRFLYIHANDAWELPAGDDDAIMTPTPAQS